MRNKTAIIHLLLFTTLSLCFLFIACNGDTTAPDDETDDPYLQFEYSEEDDGYIITQFLTNDTDIVIPDEYNNKHVYAIAAEVFSENYRIRQVTIPSSIKKIGEKCFYNCVNLKKIAVEAQENVSIGQSCFMGCTGLTAVEIQGRLLSLPDNIFAACTALESIDLPDSITEIGSRAFVGCTSLRSLDIPDSVSSIGESAFMGCSGLQSVILPESLEEISGNMFSKCTSLSEIYIPSAVTTIDCSAFSSTTSLQRIDVDTDNPIYMSVDGMLAAKETAELLFYPCGKSEEKLIIPSSVTLIGELAFRGENNLRELILHDGITEIKNQGGVGCVRLEKLVILSPDMIIHHDAFYRGAITYKNGIETGRTQYEYPFTVYCLPGSTAIDYAENNNIAFELIDPDDPKG